MSRETEWACNCGPHEEQMYDRAFSDSEKLVPLFCMEHRRHLPCRECWYIEGDGSDGIE